MSEAAIKREIMLAIGRREARVFNNPVGNGWMGNVVRQSVDSVTLAHPRRVTFGLHPGSGDLIGWRSVVITPDMVGRRVAIVASIEVKSASGKPRPDQSQWAAILSEAGGFAGIARSASDARHILGLVP